MNLGLNLHAHCHINTNGDGDRFVGVKADAHNVMVYFPLGYRLPENEEDLRQDILHLINVLSIFNDSKEKVLAMDTFEALQLVNFPVNAYMNIIRNFLEQESLYIEKDPFRKMADRGNIDWAASLKRCVSFFQDDGSPFFYKYVVKGSSPNENNSITQIHKYCVYEAFKILGWLFTPYFPSDPHIPLEKDRFLHVLRKKLSNTFNDRDKRLFMAMISMIECLDTDGNKQYYFGTDRFEYVWERLIDEVFGIRSKEEFFPRTKWTLRYGGEKVNYPLEPDSIMIFGGKIYVLDAKYYRYGVSGLPKHLPDSASINKQITYGEYIDHCDELKVKYGDTIYNAFLMPYNKDDNPFRLEGKQFANIGEATIVRKQGQNLYDRVQGIVVDMRLLMNNYYGSHTSKIKEMAVVIEHALVENDEQSLKESHD